MTDVASTTSAEDSSPRPARPEGSPGVLSEIQSLSEELKTLHEVIDDLLSGISFDGSGVPVAFEQASWLMTTARRLNLLILERAYS
jgi:hypothetical protein